jgi:flavin-dependent dehydrogenase
LSTVPLTGRTCEYDLIVIGAGPGGCAAAIAAAKRKAKVLLLERGRFPRHKVCGEFVSAESLDLLGRLLVPEKRALISSAPRIPQGRIFADGAEICAEIDPPAASITRFELDSALWSSCLQSGIEARQDGAAQAVEGTGPFVVSTKAESVGAKAVINATGRWSNLTSPAIRAWHTNERWIGIKAHFSESNPPASVDLYFFDGGYCGVQPIANNAVNACAMVKANAATTLADLLKLHPALRERSRSWQPLMDPVTTSPLIFHDPEPVFAGILQVGDSATFVDPFVGDGISLALRSGALAAECLAPLIEGKCTLAQAAENYSLQYCDRLSHVFRASSVMRRTFSWPVAVRRPLFALLQKTPRLTKRLVRMTR